jgi:hypothetical protein
MNPCVLSLSAEIAARNCRKMMNVVGKTGEQLIFRNLLTRCTIINLANADLLNNQTGPAGRKMANNHFCLLSKNILLYFILKSE